MLVIMLTGSYNFFNILTVVILLSLLSDEGCRGKCWVQMDGSSSKLDFPAFVARFLGVEAPPSLASHRRLKDLFEPVAVIGGLIAVTLLLFDVQLHVDGWNTHVHCAVAFTKEQFNQFLLYSIDVGIGLGAMSLVLVSLASLYRAASSRFAL